MREILCVFSAGHFRTPQSGPSRYNWLRLQTTKLRGLRLSLASVCAALLIAGLACTTAFAAGIAVDVKVSANQNSAVNTVSSPVFSTKTAGELLLAFISSDSLSSPNTTVKSVSGGGLTWVLVVRTNVRPGTSEIWRAYAPATLHNATATATLSQSVVSTITVMSYTGVSQTGADGSGAIGAIGSGHNSSGAPSASLVTTQNNSLVVGAGNDYDYAIPRTPASGQTVVSQDLSSTQDTYWVQIENATTAVKGTKVTLEDTAPTSDQYDFSICEILPESSASSAELTLSSSSVSFGNVTDGATASESITLNSSGTLPLTISSASIKGTGFSIVAGSWPQTIAAGHSLTLQLEFAPNAAGTVTGQLVLDSNSASGATTDVALTGTGVTASDPVLSLSATSLSFGSVSDGSSETLSLLLTSTGTSPVTVSSDKISGAGFSIVGGTLPVTLAPKQNVTVRVEFLPEAAGSAAGTLIVNTNSNGSGGSFTITLAGTGVAVAHSVDLSWDAPTDSPQPVSGYHIYRSIGGGSFALINSGVETQTSYVDNTVAASTTYNYEVRSVDSSGVESVPSNEVTVTVP